jgi:hypothetical protein
MATFDEVYEAVKRWVEGFEDKCMECMERNQGVFVHLVTEQMYSGLRGDGTYITPSYDDDPFFEEPGMWYHDSEGYKAWKGAITPPMSSSLLGLPPRPYDVPNLFINGKFYSEIYTVSGDRQIELRVVESGDGPSILGKYGDELFDLVGTSVQYFNEEYLLPHLQDFFNECGL